MVNTAQTPRAISVISAISPPIDTIGTIGIGSGIVRLQSMPAPGFGGFTIWPRLVADAVWLYESGRAQKAVDAGWTEQELFGWSETTWHSMTVWLNGSRSLVVGETFDGPVHTKWACKRSGGERLFFIRNMAAKPPDDVVMLRDLPKK